MKCSNHRGKRPAPRPLLSSTWSALLLCGLLGSLLVGCTSLFATPTQSGTPIAVSASSTATANDTASPAASAAVPVITLQVSGCPALSINWDSLAGTHAGVDKVQKVICGSLEGPGSLTALVEVRYYSPDARLDISVYDTLYGAPVRRFNVQGLQGGDAFISSLGSVATAEINPDDPVKGAVDLFKEYQWNGAAFTQVLFPGLYPDVTRYQAEAAQARVNAEIAALQPGQSQGQITDAWRLQPGSLAARLARSVFHWTNFTVTPPSHPGLLTVLPFTVTNLAAGGGGFVAVIHHLNEVPTNIFEIWQVNSIDGHAALSSVPQYAALSSPVSVKGSYLASGSLVGEVVLYDDTYTAVGGSGQISGPASGGYVQFTVSISYHLPPGLQEGVVAFYPTDQNNVSLSNQAVLVKVFLKG